MQEVNNILKILKGTREAFREGDSQKIKELSNQTINTASRTQDVDNITVAVIVYSLSKILEGENYKKYEGYTVFKKIVISSLDHAIKDIETKNLEDFRKDFEKIRKEVGKVSAKLRGYIKEVFRRAQINKASRIYAHGISLERTAKLLGITMYELARYAGETGISDTSESKTLSAKDRIKLAQGMFR
jgi:hypothetical protein